MSRSLPTLLAIVLVSSTAASSFACGPNRVGMKIRAALSGGGFARQSGWQSQPRYSMNHNSYQSSRVYASPSRPQYVESQPRYASTPQYHSAPGYQSAPSYPTSPSYPSSGVISERVISPAPAIQAAPIVQASRVVPSPEVQNGVSATQPSTNAKATALDLLRQMGGDDSGIPSFKPADKSGQADTQEHVGKWNATLPNNATVQLELFSNGSFRWVASNGGKASTFEGHYTLSGSRLTLVRSDDQQQMSGSWASVGSGKFNFRIDDAKDSGLNFARV